LLEPELPYPQRAMLLYFSGEHKRKLKLMAISFNSHPARLPQF
jgi:hypothetical protein